MTDSKNVDKHKKKMPLATTDLVPGPDELGPGEQALRKFDASLARWLGASAGEDVYDDFYQESEWLVNLYRVGDIIGKLRIDLNRNGTWDEEWVLKDYQVIRMVNPEGEERFKDSYILKDYRWVKQ